MKLHSIRHRVPFKTGRLQRYCGPGAISAITGRTAECAAAWINWMNGKDPHMMVRGSSYQDVIATLRILGYRVSRQPVDNMTLARFLKTRPAALKKAMLLIDAANHWLVVQGYRTVCTMSGGVKVALSQGAVRRGRVRAVYLVAEDPNADAVRRKRNDPMPEWVGPDREWPKSDELVLTASKGIPQQLVKLFS